MESASVASNEELALRAIFISYASADRKQALSVCKAIERRGPKCWISARDVQPGENYQEAIVRSIRNARAIVLVFSEAANNSDEIKKELSLASRYRVPVMALRLEDVEPSDAFAYELSTRQWLDAFEGWDQSIDSLVCRIEQLAEGGPPAVPSASPPPRRTKPRSLRRLSIGTLAAVLVLALLAGGWWLLRPARAVAHDLTVRLSGFQSLSKDLPAGIHDAIDAELMAAFNADGVIGVSTTPAAAPGNAPAYALGGTIHRVGDTIRVITRLNNERSGAVLWSNSIDYPAEDFAKIPHKIAVAAGIVVRCGLSGAATYRKPLPDNVFKDYMQYCQQSWDYGGTKTLLPAQRVVAALPDFSWGWSAVQTGYMQAAAYEEPGSRRAEELRVAGLQAAEKALALDPKNSEALDRKTYLIDPRAWLTQEKLYKAAIAAKPLDCGCEHYGYGLMLGKVGRLNDAIEQQRAATNMLALWPDSQLALAQVLLAAGSAKEAKEHLESAADLSTQSNLAQWIAVTLGTETGDYAAAIAALKDPTFEITAKPALLTAYEALSSGNPQQKMNAIKTLLEVPKEEQGDRVATLLAALGAPHEALQVASDKPWLFWRKSMRPVLDDPACPGVSTQICLLAYWKQAQVKPDVCSQANAPAFCKTI
jgi:tetratricopeptide (TPR) repeat protein